MKRKKGGKGERRENIEEIPTFFRRLVERRVEEKRIERNAVRSVIRPVASGERKNIEIDEIGRGWPSLSLLRIGKSVSRVVGFFSLSLFYRFI